MAEVGRMGKLYKREGLKSEQSRISSGLEEKKEEEEEQRRPIRCLFTDSRSPWQQQQMYF